jgi:orotate phosphoribosyltransferase
MQNNTHLASQIYQISHLTGDFLLRSGTRSSEYFDKYRFESEPELLKQIAKAMAAKMPSGIDYLAGLELGGIPLATALALEIGKPAVFVRKEAKTYGTCQLAEGKDIKGKTLCVVEDVITTGGQVVESVNELRQRGAHVEHVLCVINRAGTTPEPMKAAGLTLHHLFTMDELKLSPR